MFDDFRGILDSFITVRLKCSFCSPWIVVENWKRSMVMVYEQGPGSSGVRIIMSWDLNREIFIFVILSPWDMIDYIIWGEQTITAILCLILIWCLKCMIFWNKHFQWWQVYQKVFHVCYSYGESSFLLYSHFHHNDYI